MFVNIDSNGMIRQVVQHCSIKNDAAWVDIGDYNFGELFSRGVSRYKYFDNQISERTQAEIDADIAAIPPPEPTPQEQTDALILDHEERLIYLELGV